MRTGACRASKAAVCPFARSSPAAERLLHAGLPPGHDSRARIPSEELEALNHAVFAGSGNKAFCRQTYVPDHRWNCTQHEGIAC
jgi:hypothetical protein